MVTIEARGCQKTLAQKIVRQGGDYLLALKGNQSRLPEDVERHFVQPTTQNGRRGVRQKPLRKDMDVLKSDAVGSVPTLSGFDIGIPNGRTLTAESPSTVSVMLVTRFHQKHVILSVVH